MVREKRKKEGGENGCDGGGSSLTVSVCVVLLLVATISIPWTINTFFVRSRCELPQSFLEPEKYGVHHVCFEAHEY